MKKLFILSVLFICFSSVIYSQRLNEIKDEHLIKPGFQSNIYNSLINQSEKERFNNFENRQPQLKCISKNNWESSAIYKPDKVTYDTTNKRTFTYDNSGNLITELRENLSEGAWVNSYRWTYTYDNSGNLLTELEENWSDGKWVNSLRWTYTYDNSGNLLTYLNENWSDGTWVNSLRWTYTYDNSGNRLTELREYWSEGVWVNIYRYTYTYDNSGNLLTALEENFANGTWVNSWRWTYTYDNSGNLLTKLGENWSEGAWVNAYRWTYTYDNSGNLLTYLNENWSDSAWVNAYRWTYTYDNSGNLLTELGENWSDGAWVNLYRNTYTYDNSSNLLTELGENWSGGAWINDYRYTYTFDQNGNCTHGEAFRFQNNEWLPHRTSLDIWYNNHEDVLWSYASVIDVEYILITEVATGKINVISYNLAQNYPNPFNPSTTIKYSIPKESFVTLKIFDVLGKEISTLVNERKLAGNYLVNFNASNLPSGIYFYRMQAIPEGRQAGNFVLTKKFVLLK